MGFIFAFVTLENMGIQTNCELEALVKNSLAKEQTDKSEKCREYDDKSREYRARKRLQATT